MTTPSFWRCSFRGLRSRFEARQLGHWILFTGSHQVPHHNLLRPQLLLLCPLLLLLLTAQCLSVPETFCPCRPDYQRPASSHLSTGSSEPGPLDFVLGNNWKVRLLPKSQSSPLICQPTTLWSCGATTYLAPRSCEVDETSRVSWRALRNLESATNSHQRLRRVCSLLELDGDCPLSCGEKHGRHRGSSHSSFAFRLQRHCILALCAGRRGSRAVRRGISFNFGVGPAHETGGILALRPRDGVRCRRSPCRADSRASRSHWSINEGGSASRRFGRRCLAASAFTCGTPGHCGYACRFFSRGWTLFDSLGHKGRCGRVDQFRLFGVHGAWQRALQPSLKLYWRSPPPWPT